MMNIDAISIKLPTFRPAQPQIWFTQAEAQFHLRNIKTDETKYYHVLSSLDQDTIQRVSDLVTNPPAKEKYTALKNRLLQTFGLSKAERAARILNIPGLGDRKPSQLLDEMLSHL